MGAYLNPLVEQSFPSELHLWSRLVETGPRLLLVRLYSMAWLIDPGQSVRIGLSAVQNDSRNLLVPLCCCPNTGKLVLCCLGKLCNRAAVQIGETRVGSSETTKLGTLSLDREISKYILLLN